MIRAIAMLNIAIKRSTMYEYACMKNGRTQGWLDSNTLLHYTDINKSLNISHTCVYIQKESG